MRYRKIVPVVLVFFTFLVLPAWSFSEVKISLKNGREIIADNCRDTKGKLVCEKMGGSFEIDKKDVLETKGITIERSGLSGSQTQPAEPEPADSNKGTGKKSSDAKDSTKPAEGVLIKGASPEAEKRLDQITKRKLELMPERDKLIQEQQKLLDDVKDTGMIKKQEQLDAIKKRIADLEQRIKQFNEEAKKLNEEENRIIEGLNKQK
jgi:molecular chaperone DnaK (HSP70)